MAEKDPYLIIAFFPSAEAAQEAGMAMKEWDKERKDIDLGAMSILTVDAQGELHEAAVGDRKTGSGAKWGVLAGAALGLLTGGVGLIGGAIVGLAAGALGGSLFHKKIGMTDDDQQRLESHLKAGGAALATMMDFDEIESVISEFNKMDAEVATYNVPQEVLDDLDRMAKGEKVIQDRIEKDTSVEMPGEEPD
ncbi:MAG: DUF1269 domain-containing protein [Candidatus Promineifilaceae bacterium]